MTKALWQEAAKVKEVAVSASHGPIPADKITRVSITSIPIPVEFGIPVEGLPETKNIKEALAKNPAKVTQFYYICRVCSHASQNKPSMMTNTRRCLKIKLVCQVCQKEYESADYAEKHITEAHNGHCEAEALSKSEAEAVVLAVERGCVHEVKALISAGADVNTKIIGASVLYCAIRCGAVESAEELLKAGADVNSKTFEKGTPLMRAVRSGCDKCIRLLLKYGAYVNEKDVQGYNAFDFLLKPNKTKAEGIFYLLYAAGEETMDEKGVSRVIYSEKPNNLVDESIHNLCIYAFVIKRIRSHLLKLDAHNNLFLRISNLNLPSKIIKNQSFRFELNITLSVTLPSNFNGIINCCKHSYLTFITPFYA